MMTPVASRSTQQMTGSSKQNGHRPQLEVVQRNSARKVGCGIVHLIPGRVRLRVPRLICDADLAQRLPTLLLKNSQVIGVRVRRAAASIVIYYQMQSSTLLKHGRKFSSLSRQKILKTQIHDFIRIIQTANQSLDMKLPEVLSQSFSQVPVRLKLLPNSSIVRACSLEVRQVVVPPDQCGLFRSKKGRKLRGSALAARIRKLFQHGVLYLPTGME